MWRLLILLSSIRLSALPKASVDHQPHERHPIPTEKLAKELPFANLNVFARFASSR